MLNVLVPEVGLQGAGIVALVGQRKATGVPKHVRVRREAKLGRRTSALHKTREARRGEGRAAFGHEDEG